MSTFREQAASQTHGLDIPAHGESYNVWIQTGPDRFEIFTCQGRVDMVHARQIVDIIRANGGDTLVTDSYGFGVTL